MIIARARRRASGAALIGVALAGSALISLALSGCADLHVSESPEQTAPPPPPMQTPITAPDVPGPPPAHMVGPPAPAFPRPSPGVTADAASMAAAHARLADARVPPGAHRSTTRPHGVASALALGSWCEPMADAIGYWTVPGHTVKSVVSYLSSHAPQKLTLAYVTSSNAAGNPHVVAQMVEYAAAPSGQDGLIYEVTPVGTGAGIRDDALVTPSNATCATAAPGAILGTFGG